MADAAVCIALHDVAPATWPACRRLLALLDALGPVPVSLLVVPDYHRRGAVCDDAAFVRAIEARLARGDEVVLHGYYHLDEAPRARAPLQALRRRVYTAGEGEFAALDAGEARRRLLAGLAMLGGRLGWPLAGFVAPAWLLGAGARAALSGLPFRYTTTLGAVYRLPDWRSSPAPSLVYSVRRPWRRAASHHWNRWLLARTPAERLLRIGLHPADAQYPDVVDDWGRLIAAALRQRRPLTKRAWVERACGDVMPRC